MSQTQKQTISEILVVAGVAAFAYYKYSKMTAAEKQKIHEDLKEIGQNVAKGLVPDNIRSFLPAHWK